MKKGFTLIELLAVIAVLAIILIVAVPSVINIITEVKNNLLIKNSEMLKKSAKNYLMANPTMFPSDGGSIEITVNTLVSNKYVDEFKDPTTKTTCSGYVTVSNIDGAYDYEPHLKCGSANTIDNSIEDALLVHYTFDDYDEPTNNLYPGPITAGQYFTSAYDGEYGFGAQTNSVTYIDNTDKLFASVDVQKVTRIDSGINQSLYLEWSQLVTRTGAIYPVGTSKTISFWYYGTFGTSLTVYFGGNTGTLSLFANNAISGNGTTSIVLPVNQNGWNRVTFQLTNTGAIDATFSWGWMMLHSNALVTTLPNTDYWEFTGIQVENKPYATPYVIGNRIATVNNQTSNLYDATIDISSSTSWKTEKGNGYQSFNGLNSTSASKITSSLAYEKNNDYTISLWAKRNDDSNMKMLLGGNIGNNLSMGIMATSSGTFKFHTYDTADKDLAASSLNAFPIGQWVNLVATIKYSSVISDIAAGTVILYANGIKVGENTFSNVGIFTRTLVIGSPGNNTSNRAFNGDIDDVRIYGRVMGDEEIRYEYEYQKSKY